MTTLGFVEAFAKYEAKLANPMWAVSAIADDGAIVISCWDQYFRKGDSGVLNYVDSLSRWVGNDLGNKLLETHLLKAFTEKLPVRMVVATAENPEADATQCSGFSRDRLGGTRSMRIYTKTGMFSQ